MDENKVQQESTVKETKTLRTLKEVIEDTMKLLDSDVVERVKKLEDLTKIAVISTQEFDKRLDEVIEEKVDQLFYSHDIEKKVEALVEEKVKVGEVDVENMVSDAINDADIDQIVKDWCSDNDIPDESRVEEMIGDTLKEGYYTDENKVNKLIKAYIDDTEVNFAKCIKDVAAMQDALNKRIILIEQSLAKIADGFRALLFAYPATDKPEVK